MKGRQAVDDFTLARANMVNSQVYVSGVVDHRILSILRTMPREHFVPASFRSIAYIDDEIPLEVDSASERRFLMNPMPFARLIQLADITEDDLILDIGCAPGYSSAILAYLGCSVVALESDPLLVSLAKENLLSVGADNVAVVTGSLQAGYLSEGPYDVIFLGGAVDHVPQELFDQCKDGGRLVTVLRKDGVGTATLFQREGSSLSCRYAFDAMVNQIPGFSDCNNFEF